MPRKPASQYECSSCGATAGSWTGRCGACGEWNTLQETLDVRTRSAGSGGRSLISQPLTMLAGRDEARHQSGLSDFDMVMGGGIVAGSVSLIAGQPGIGKSTLMLQLAGAYASHQPVLYISGEESGHQIALRAGRLGLVSDNVQIVSSSSADDIAATITASDARIVIVDSIQTVGCTAISSPPGSIAQITNSTQLLSAAAKATGTALLLVGHVTKEGSIAGPKVLEHVVDVVLNLEGDRYGGFKLLRAIKNRYGSTNETAIFEMEERGLVPVSNPSAALLAERQVSDGSVVLATMEGTRPLLVEVQALVNRTAYGYPKRAASGIDLNRLNLLVAMLERRTKLNLADQDVYVNIVGGIRIGEPAADLAVVMAVGSAAKGLQLKTNAVVFGEVGLSGEIRHVPLAEKRIAEAKKLGFKAAIGPIQKTAKKNSYIVGVRDVREALNQFLEKE